MKNVILPVAVGVAVLGCVLAVYANMNNARSAKLLNGERYRRISAEEQLQKAQQQISAFQAELAEAASKMKTIEKVLNDGQEISKELEAVRRDRDELKQKIESLTTAVKAE